MPLRHLLLYFKLVEKVSFGGHDRSTGRLVRWGSADCLTGSCLRLVVAFSSKEGALTALGGNLVRRRMLSDVRNAEQPRCHSLNTQLLE